MKTDFSRRTFRPERHYSGVIQQQGRRTLARDVIGACGGPKGEAGFEISVDGSGQLRIGAGRYYVDGLLVENEDECAFESQPDLPTADAALESALGSPGRTVVYLDVWERVITALDDPTLLEPALGGPDTTVRLKVVWQVRLVPVAEAKGLRCGKRRRDVSRASLDVRTGGGGYSGRENQLYRVEIHSVDDTGAARFKWSRDNASLALPVEKIDGNTVTIADGPSNALDRLASGDWLELTDDALELDGAVGKLAQVAKVDLKNRSIRLKEPKTPLSETDAGVDQLLHPKARRWHAVGVAAPAGETADWTALDDGIEVSFGGGGYQVGDYWLIPARTSTAGVQWPGGPQPAERTEHACCPLAEIDFGKRRGRWRVIEDKRRIFGPLSRPG